MFAKSTQVLWVYFYDIVLIIIAKSKLIDVNFEIIVNCIKSIESKMVRTVH